MTSTNPLKTIRDRIWYDLIDAKFGDDYLTLYLVRQRNIRRWFKIFTIIFSAGGIFSAFASAKIPTIISLIAIGTVQVLQSIENFIIHSENDLDELRKLRMLYYARSIKLEKLWDSFNRDKIDEDEATNQFFALRELAGEIEELDSRLYIRSYNGLNKKANIKTTDYLNRYFL